MLRDRDGLNLTSYLDMGEDPLRWNTLQFSAVHASKPLITLSLFLTLKTHSLTLLMDGQDHTCEEKN